MTSAQPLPVAPDPGPCKRCGKPQAMNLAGIEYCPRCRRAEHAEIDAVIQHGVTFATPEHARALDADEDVIGIRRGR